MCRQIAVAALVFSAGCSFLVDVGKDQCAQDADCEQAGLPGVCEDGVCVAPAVEPRPDGGMGDPNSCFGSLRCDDGKICWKDQCVVERDVERFLCDPPPAEEVDDVPFDMHVVEFVSQDAPKGMVVRACRANDVSCADPEESFVDEDGTGFVSMKLPHGFSGFLEVMSENALPALWYFTRPLVAATHAKPLRVVSPDTLILLSAIAGFSTDASKGLVILEAFDCAEAAVGGMHFEEDKRTARPFYIVNGAPNTESTVTVRDEKADEAPGGFVNASPGFTVFTARIGVDGPELGKFNANVRASTVTYLDIHP
jgi:hypothetical protein